MTQSFKAFYTAARKKRRQDKLQNKKKTTQGDVSFSPASVAFPKRASKPGSGDAPSSSTYSLKG